MDRIPFTAERRTQVGSGNARRMRKGGRVPGVVYGRGKEPVSLALDARELTSLLKASAGSAVLVDLTVTGNGDGEPQLCFIKEVQVDPVTRRPLNVDFLSISLTEPLSLTVPIATQGEAVGVTEGGGILQQTLRQLSISCLPTQIPDEITIDVSGLAIGQSLHVSDLPVPEGVTVETDLDEVVVRVSAPTMIEEEPTEEEVEGELREGEEAPEDGEGEEKGAEGDDAEEKSDND